MLQTFLCPTQETSGAEGDQTKTTLVTLKPQKGGAHIEIQHFDTLSHYMKHERVNTDVMKTTHSSQVAPRIVALTDRV